MGKAKRSEHALVLIVLYSLVPYVFGVQSIGVSEYDPCDWLKYSPVRVCANSSCCGLCISIDVHTMYTVQFTHMIFLLLLSLLHFETR